MHLKITLKSQANDQEHQEGSFAQLEDVDGECLLCF